MSSDFANVESYKIIKLLSKDVEKLRLIYDMSRSSAEVGDYKLFLDLDTPTLCAVRSDGSDILKIVINEPTSLDTVIFIIDNLGNLVERYGERLRDLKELPDKLVRRILKEYPDFSVIF